MIGTWNVKYLMRNEVYEGYSRDGIIDGRNTFQLKMDKVVDLDLNPLFYLKVSNNGQHVSHSCNPNCVIKVVCLCDEYFKGWLTIDYY